MTSILIIFIEFLIIVILAMVIKGYGKERYLMKEETKKYYAAADAHCAEYAAAILRHAALIRLKLSQEMYRGSFKKNKVVKETCRKFFDELVAKLRQP